MFSVERFIESQLRYRFFDTAYPYVVIMLQNCIADAPRHLKNTTMRGGDPPVLPPLITALVTVWYNIYTLLYNRIHVYTWTRLMFNKLYAHTRTHAYYVHYVVV